MCSGCVRLPLRVYTDIDKTKQVKTSDKTYQIIERYELLSLLLSERCYIVLTFVENGSHFYVCTEIFKILLLLSFSLSRCDLFIAGFVENCFTYVHGNSMKPTYVKKNEQNFCRQS